LTAHSRAVQPAPRRPKLEACDWIAAKILLGPIRFYGRVSLSPLRFRKQADRRTPVVPVYKKG
jgi:hypothetical protein